VICIGKEFNAIRKEWFETNAFQEIMEDHSDLVKKWMKEMKFINFK